MYSSLYPLACLGLHRPRQSLSIADPEATVDNLFSDNQCLRHLVESAVQEQAPTMHVWKGICCLQVMELCAGGELFDRIVQRGHYRYCHCFAWQRKHDCLQCILSLPAFCWLPQEKTSKATMCMQKLCTQSEASSFFVQKQVSML